MVVRALATLPEAAAAISPGLQDSDERVRAATIQALGRLRTQTSTQALVGALTDPSPFNRAEAARLLADTGGDVAVHLLPMLDDRDSLVRLTAAEGLARLGATEAIPDIERLARHTRDDEEKRFYQDLLERLR